MRMGAMLSDIQRAHRSSSDPAMKDSLHCMRHATTEQRLLRQLYDGNYCCDPPAEAKASDDNGIMFSVPHVLLVSAQYYIPCPYRPP